MSNTSSLAPDFSIRPEDQLLLCCARTRFDSDMAERIQTLLRGSIDWDYLLDRASAHGIKPLLCNGLGDNCSKAVPKLVSSLLRRYFLVHSLNNLWLTRELIRLLGLLQKSGISAIPWKGPVLAAIAYGDIALRQFSDLDILVREQEAMRAKDLLLSSGYQTLYDGSAEDEVAFHSLRQVYEMVRKDGRATVELQWAITSRTFYFPLDPASLWEQVETVSLEGASVRNLGPEDLLLVLCIHGSKHHWGKLMWICDIAELLRVYSKEINWDRVAQRASGLGGTRMLSLAILLAHDLLGAKIPEYVLRRMQAEPKVQFLADEVRSGLFNGGPLMAVERPAFYIGLRERAQDRIRCRLYLGYRMISPRAQAWTLRLAHTGQSALDFLRRS